jgi:hypothetical protein
VAAAPHSHNTKVYSGRALTPHSAPHWDGELWQLVTFEWAATHTNDAGIGPLWDNNNNTNTNVRWNRSLLRGLGACLASKPDQLSDMFGGTDHF